MLERAKKLEAERTKVTNTLREALISADGDIGKVSDEVVEKCSKILVTLDLHGLKVNLTQQLMEKLLQKFPRVEQIIFPERFDISVIEMASKLPSFQKISFNCIGYITRSRLDCSQLGVMFSPQRMRVLANLFPDIETIVLPKTFKEEDVDTLQLFPKLAHLSFNESDSATDSCIARLRTLKNLKSVDVMNCKNITPKAIDTFKQLPLESLTWRGAIL